jgi:hypothetical protein
MRVVEQLIDHLRRTGHLTPGQLAELRQMGLLKDPPPDYDSPFPDVEPETDDDGRIDVLDAYGDRLIDAARRAGVRRRKGGPKRSALQAKNFIAAVTEAVTGLQSFLDAVVEVARRVGVDGGADAALSAVASADAARLEAVLVRDSLWARLWPHVPREPVFEALSEHERRRFSGLVEAASQRDKALPRGLMGDPALRRAIDIVEAHRVLSAAFGRAATTVGPRRVSGELNLAADPTAYEVLVILRSARTPWHTIADLPVLGPAVGLPVPGRLNRPCFESGWAIAARIDPVAVLPYMNWCTQAWAALPQDPISRTAAGVMVGARTYRGAWIQPAYREWFSLRDMGPKWVVLRHSRHCPNELGEVSQTLTFDGIDYAHICPDLCKPPRKFRRTDGSQTLSVTPSRGLAVAPDRETVRADYGALWAAGLIDMPLLTCPKEWELT